MNASPANLNSASAIQSPSAAGKPQDSAQDSPFSQVLSSEIAQNRRGNEAQKAEKPEKTGKPDSAAENANAAVDPATVSEIPAVQTDNIPITAAFDMLRAEAVPVLPGSVLALAIPANQPQTDALRPDDTAQENAASLIANLQTGRGSRKGLPSKALQADQPGNTSKGSQAQDPTQLAKVAAEFGGQLAAARQADSRKTGEPFSELMANPIMRATPQAPVNAPTPTSGAAASQLAPSVGTTAWGQALGEKIVWMAAGAQQTASLTLNPPNLGPLQIVLNISNDQATASFFSAQPEVRQALEAAFPRLREMMSEAGIQLGQATVSADTPQQQAFDQQSQRVAPSFSGADEVSPLGLQSIQGPVMRSGRGLVDTFA